MRSPLHPSPLYVICDADACVRAGWSLIDFADACLEGGARLLQIRAKRADAGWLLDCTSRIVELAAAASVDAQVIVNDRADLALIAGAQGVHVGQDDLPPTPVRNILGNKVVVGLSTHTELQLQQALLEPVTYIAIGPVFETASKATGYQAAGVGRVREVVDVASVRGLPVVAIGGITLERAPSVIAAGASSVAIIGDLLATGDPATRVRDYLRRLEG